MNETGSTKESKGWPAGIASCYGEIGKLSLAKPQELRPCSQGPVCPAYLRFLQYNLRVMCSLFMSLCYVVLSPQSSRFLLAASCQIGIGERGLPRLNLWQKSSVCAFSGRSLLQHADKAHTHSLSSWQKTNKITQRFLSFWHYQYPPVQTFWYPAECGSTPICLSLQYFHGVRMTSWLFGASPGFLVLISLSISPGVGTILGVIH